MENAELYLSFLEGVPIYIEPNLYLHKVSFNEINKIGYIKYNQVLNTLCLDEGKVSMLTNVENIDPYTFLILNIMWSKDNDYLDNLLQVLSCIFGQTATYDENGEFFIIGDFGVLYRENYNEFQDLLRKRNCLETIDEDKDNPANEMARILLEKRKKARERVSKAKASQSSVDSGVLTIADLISIYAEAEHIYIEDVFRYDIYQFNDQFNRMKILKEYSVNIQALLAGAKSEDINFQHWLSKIKK